MVEHHFGGTWTIEKLDALRKYLGAYTTILRSNPKAQHYTISYVDAFAGTGYRSPKQEDKQSTLPFIEDDPDVKEYLKGSARIALEVQPPFHWYIFVDNKNDHVNELENLKTDYPYLAHKINIKKADANSFLQEWCKTTDWGKNRAVVFLDPYGMQVEWSTVESIAKTKAIDLWWLFPYGIAIKRLLPKDQKPPVSWAKALTRTFGTESWMDVFYTKTTTTTLFGEERMDCRTAEDDIAGQFIINRLKTVFYAVAEKPLVLCNSRNNPMYLLCFAAGNPNGAKTAVKIAEDIIGIRR